jgi:hypothetical protein
MKFPFWAAVFLLSPALLTQAQVSVEIRQSQDQFLPGEAMPLAVRITNLSGQPLRLGTTDDWLTFSVESLEGAVVAQNSDVPVAGEFQLPTSKVGTKRVDISPSFAMTQPGRYQVAAIVKIKDWDREVKSPPLRFNIIQGTKLWEQEFGLPRVAGVTNGPPEVRKYILQQANYLKGQLRLYLRVTDDTGSKTYKVVNIGPLRSFSQPEHQLDDDSFLHLIYALGPQPSGSPGYLYTCFNPDGEIVTRQVYEYVDTRPRLVTDATGKIKVTGRAANQISSNVPPATASTPETPSSARSR